MQVLGIVPTEAQQTMNFLSESSANMARNDEIVDLDENTSQPFQLVVPRKKKQPEAGKGFKVGACFQPFASLVFFFFCFLFVLLLWRVLVFVPPLLCTFFLSFNI